MKFLSTPSARRATQRPRARRALRKISIHALREEGDRQPGRSLSCAMYFYPRPPRGGRRGSRRCTCPSPRISIHALREEGDRLRGGGKRAPVQFLSTPSARRATRPNEYNLCMLIFLSTPSARRATQVERLQNVVIRISIHALREEGDPTPGKAWRGISYFYPRPPRGGRPLSAAGQTWKSLFLSTPSARRATPRHRHCQHQDPISIHALREEGDEHCRETRRFEGNFYPRPPRGGRPSIAADVAPLVLFLSTPSARRATQSTQAVSSVVLISIHALREEGDSGTGYDIAALLISIHALREEGDLGDHQKVGEHHRFLSTPSARRATQPLCGVGARSFDFYPRPPRGGRLSPTQRIEYIGLFLSTPSARRATRNRMVQRGRHPISIHALREEGDTSSKTMFWRAKRNFYPRPPRGGRRL